MDESDFEFELHTFYEDEHDAFILDGTLQVKSTDASSIRNSREEYHMNERRSNIKVQIEFYASSRARSLILHVVNIQ